MAWAIRQPGIQKAAKKKIKKKTTSKKKKSSNKKAIDAAKRKVAKKKNKKVTKSKVNKKKATKAAKRKVASKKKVTKKGKAHKAAKRKVASKKTTKKKTSKQKKAQKAAKRKVVKKQPLGDPKPVSQEKEKEPMPEIPVEPRIGIDTHLPQPDINNPVSNFTGRLMLHTNYELDKAEADAQLDYQNALAASKGNLDSAEIAYAKSRQDLTRDMRERRGSLNSNMAYRGLAYSGIAAGKKQELETDVAQQQNAIEAQRSAARSQYDTNSGSYMAAARSRLNRQKADVTARRRNYTVDLANNGVQMSGTRPVDGGVTMINPTPPWPGATPLKPPTSASRIPTLWEKK